MKIAILGMGNMGSAIYKRLEKFGGFELSGYDKGDDVNTGAAEADILVIAVKPQSAVELFQSIKTDLSNKLVISIMAGVSVARLAELSGTKKIVMSMPNLGVQVGKGVVGWVATGEVSDGEKETAQKIFSSMGLEIELEDENKINEITALSGSGPAYYFYLTELLAAKAIEFGFDKDMAEKIAVVTLAGSAELLADGDKTAGEWRGAVTSKGGTTEAALKYLENNKFDEIFGEAINEAKKRSEEL